MSNITWKKQPCFCLKLLLQVTKSRLVCFDGATLTSSPAKAVRTFSGGFFLFLFLCSSARDGFAKSALSGSQFRWSTRDVGVFPSSGAPRTAAQDRASSNSSRTTAVPDRTIHVGYRSGSRPRSTPKRVRMYACPLDRTSLKRAESCSAFSRVKSWKFPAIIPK